MTSTPAAKKLIVFGLLAAGFLLGVGYHLNTTALARYQLARHLSEYGETVTGSVTGKRSSLGNFGMTYTLRYDYRPPITAAELGRPAMSGTSEVSVEYFRAAVRRGRVPVHYDPARPERSILDLAHNRALSLFVPAFGFGCVFLLAGAGIVVGLIYAVWPPREKAQSSRPKAEGKNE